MKNILSRFPALFAFVIPLLVPCIACGRTLEVSAQGLSPHDALAAIREAKAKGDASAWTVKVKSGFYVLKKPLVFTPADSGSGDARVEWVGEGDGCVFAGGEPIVGWRNDGHGVWSAPIPASPGGKLAYFEQLWVNGRRADRARIPNRNPGNLADEYLRISKPHIVALTNDSGKVTYVEKVSLTNEAASALSSVSADEFAYAQMCVVHKWSFARRILRGWDGATRTAWTHSSQDWLRWRKWSEKETIVCFENVRAGFDAPGEWFYDARAGRVLYRPLPGEDMSKAVVVAPSSMMSCIVSFEGNPDAGEYVSDITFRNIAFEYGGSPQSEIPDRTGFSDAVDGSPTQTLQLQAAHRSDGMLMLFGARGIRLENCAVRHTGNYAIRISDGCISNSVISCRLEDLGAGGIFMGALQGHVAKGEALTRRVITNLAPRSNAHNRIEDCVIRAGGRFNPEGTGVALTHTSDSKVLHCDIYDFYYTGVSVGWVWGFAGSVAQRNEVAFNRIYDLGKGVMSDMGGVYTLGTSFGTTVHDNIVHDVNSYSYGGWALYTDEGSEGIVMERNLCWNTTDGGFHQHFGCGCTIRNNIFAWNRMIGAVRMRRRLVEGIPCTLNFVNNIVLVREGPLVSRGATGVGGVWANNLWYDRSGKGVFDEGDWGAWVKCGKESGGRYADPCFVDAEHFDFRLKPDSPAFALGFRAWDYSRAGCRSFR